MLQTPQRAWWKEPMVWLIAGLPAAAVVAGIATYFIAAHKPDSLVSEGYQKQGMAVVSTDAKLDEAAAALGLDARLSAEHGRFEVVLQGNLAAPPASLNLAVLHPTDAARDRVVQLFRSSQGDYAGELTDPPLGKHRIVLEPEDRSWRLAGELALSATGSWQLAAPGKASLPHPK